VRAAVTLDDIKQKMWGNEALEKKGKSKTQQGKKKQKRKKKKKKNLENLDPN